MYRTKQLTYEAVRGLSALLEANDSATSSTSLREETISTLHILIPILDEIINSEYDTGHASITLHTDTSFLVCDFCGADIFVSFFECVSCLDRDVEPHEAYHLCGGCFVEGRNCACGGLQPKQRMRFDSIIAVRNNAARLSGVPLLSFE